MLEHQYCQFLQLGDADRIVRHSSLSSPHKETHTRKSGNLFLLGTTEEQLNFLFQVPPDYNRCYILPDNSKFRPNTKWGNYHSNTCFFQFANICLIC